MDGERQKLREKGEAEEKARRSLEEQLERQERKHQ